MRNCQRRAMFAVVQDCDTESYAANAKEKAIASQEAKTMNKAREYIAALCHMKDGGLMPYDSERFIATTKAEAAAKAQKWAMGWYRRRKDVASSDLGWGQHVHQRAKSTLMLRAADESLPIRPMAVIHPCGRRGSSGATRRDQFAAGIVWTAVTVPKPIWH